MTTNSDHSVEIELSFPFADERVFRYSALEDVLELLIRNPFRSFTGRQLQRLTDNGAKTTTHAVELLTQMELVRVTSSGRSNDIRLNRERVTIPENPLFAVPQDEFRPPIRTFVERARDAVPSFSALVVFGSVARGEADRRSDIDIWILVEDGDQLLQARRAATDIASDLAEKRFTPPDEQATTGTQHRGDRYEFEVLVESVETATSYDEAIADLLTEGIAIVDSETLQEVKAAVFDGQEVATDERW